MSGKNRITVKRGPSDRARKPRGGRVAELLEVCRLEMMAGLPARRHAKGRRGDKR